MPSSPSAPPEDTLLLCLDLQPPFLAAITDGAEVLRRCEFAVAGARTLGLPVAFTEQVPEKLGSTAATVLALAPGAPVWPKTTFSALADERLHAALLADRPVRHLLLAGIETSICVFQTALGAIAAGLEVTILVDCVGARRSGDAQVCLEALARHGAHLLPSETVLYSILHDTGHPCFREFTRLVKAHHAPASRTGTAD
ncbi:MAG: isochorismatase family protein [Verrucomicrobia bacterium]|nr:isochorismatase family protein [Verrucomicrobiota bacterium]